MYIIYILHLPIQMNQTHMWAPGYWVSQGWSKDTLLDRQSGLFRYSKSAAILHELHLYQPCIPTFRLEPISVNILLQHMLNTCTWTHTYTPDTVGDFSLCYTKCLLSSNLLCRLSAIRPSPADSGSPGQTQAGLSKTPDFFEHICFDCLRFLGPWASVSAVLAQIVLLPFQRGSRAHAVVGFSKGLGIKSLNM